MDEYTNVKCISDTQILKWLKTQKLYGLNLILARRVAKLHAELWRERQERNVVRQALASVLEQIANDTEH